MTESVLLVERSGPVATLTLNRPGTKNALNPELIDALTHPPAALRVGRLSTLKGAHLAFTGILSTRRSEAARAARKAGATVHGAPSAKTTVVVRGKPNPLQAAGKDAGRKLLEIKRLREKGHRITLLNEAQFWRLAGRKKS